MEARRNCFFHFPMATPKEPGSVSFFFPKTFFLAQNEQKKTPTSAVFQEFAQSFVSTPTPTPPKKNSVKLGTQWHVPGIRQASILSQFIFFWRPFSFFFLPPVPWTLAPTEIETIPKATPSSNNIWNKTRYNPVTAAPQQPMAANQVTATPANQIARSSFLSIGFLGLCIVLTRWFQCHSNDDGLIEVQNEKLGKIPPANQIARSSFLSIDFLKTTPSSKQIFKKTR